MGIRSQPRRANLHAVDAVELAAGLCWKALQAGAIVFNLTTCEDVCIRNQRLTGVVVNRTNIAGALPVDPIVFSAKAVLDATGHEAVLVQCLRRRGLLPTSVSAQEALWTRPPARPSSSIERVRCFPVCGSPA